jgi:signal transduction histidine kinase
MTQRLLLLSLKQRVIFLMVAIAVVTAALTAASITIIDFYKLRDNFLTEQELTASITAERNRYILKFGQRGTAAQNLEIFRMRPTVEMVCIYDERGEVFAHYPAQANGDGMTSSGHACPSSPRPGSYFEETYLETFKPIELKGEVVGGIYLRSSLSIIDTYLSRQLMTILGVVAVAIAVAYGLALRLQRSITQPILTLADTAHNISTYRDYSIRAPLPGPRSMAHSREIATLISAFNEMLDEIEERNLTLQRKNIELDRARELAETANMSKSRFLASISHELRTPLNAIIGFSSLIRSQFYGAINQKYLEYAEDIHESGVHLLEIINDILDLSKAEAGKLILELEEFHVGKAIRKVLSILGERAEKGGVKIFADVPDDLPYLIADHVRFIQIMLNIVSNAVKFTEPGGRVSIAVQSRPITGQPGHVQFIITVTDTGIGMRPEDMEKALQSFGQVDGDLNRRYEGTGLGLPLTKKLVELHGGNLVIESEKGVGTTVQVRLVSDPDSLKK